MFLSLSTKIIENHSWLDASQPPLRIDLDDPCHVFREIQNERAIAALARQRSTAATTKDGRSVLARGRDGGNDVIVVAGKYDPDRNLPVVGTIGCIESAATVIKADFTTHMAPEGVFQCRAVD